MSDVLKVVIHLEIDRKTGTVSWSTEGVRDDTTDAALVYEALLSILNRREGQAEKPPSVH